jgi:hypothetical protein
MDLTPSEINLRDLKKVENRSIVLFHNRAKNTLAAFPALIEKLQVCYLYLYF